MGSSVKDFKIGIKTLKMKNRTTAQLYAMVFLLTGFLSIEAQIPGMPAMALKEAKNVFGGKNDDIAYSMVQTSDKGYIMTGGTASNDGDVSGNHGRSDIWIVKLSESGALQWQKTLGGAGNDEAHSIAQTSDGGYAVAGSAYSNDGDVSGNHGGGDIWVVKISGAGVLQWQKTLGGTGNDDANSIVQTSDGGYAVAGSTYSNDGDISGNHGSRDLWVVKLSGSGALQWQKTLGGTGNDEGNSIARTSDGGYIVSGSTRSNDGDVSGNHGGTDFWVVKISGSGTIQWQKTLGGTGIEYNRSIVQTSDGGYAVAGYTFSNDDDVSGNHGGGDMWVVKVSGAGVLQWQRTLGGSGIESGRSIVQTSDGGYVVTGYTESNNDDVSGNHGGGDIWVVKLNATGVLQWQRTLGGTGSESTLSIVQTSDAGYAVAGFTNSNDGNVIGPANGLYDFLFLRLNAAGNGIHLYEDMPQ